MPTASRLKFAWMDVLLLVFLASLAVLYPVSEIPRATDSALDWILPGFRAQVHRLGGTARRIYSTLIKIVLASLLIAHTGGINSSYYLIYYLPVVTAAIYSGPWGTLGWTALSLGGVLLLSDPGASGVSADGERLRKNWASASSSSFWPPSWSIALSWKTAQQAERYRLLAEQLAETNQRLEQAQAEARRSERLAALGQLTAGLAHEIRNPLGVIKGSAETLKKSSRLRIPSARNWPDIFRVRSTGSNSLVSRFLDFARPLELTKHPEEIPPLVDHALKAARDRWPESKVQVERTLRQRSFPPFRSMPN